MTKCTLSAMYELSTIHNKAAEVVFSSRIQDENVVKRYLDLVMRRIGRLTDREVDYKDYERHMITLYKGRAEDFSWSKWYPQEEGL